MENAKQTKTNQSVEKALQILEIMAEHGEMRLQDISKLSGLPASTALRMVNTLVCCGYAFQNAQTQLYSLTFKLGRLGSQIKESQAICAVAKPFMITLAQRCRETVTLAIEINSEAVFVDIEESFVNGLAVMHHIGVSVPYHIAAVGKLLLLNYSSEDIARIFAASKKPQPTPRVICSYEDLMFNLRQVVRQGYAINDEESEPGARCIACPVFDFSGRIYAGVGISGPSFRMTDDYIRTILPVLKDTAAKISASLGYTGDADLNLHWARHNTSA